MSNPPHKGKGRQFLWLQAHVSHQGDDCLTWPFYRHPNGRGRLGYLGQQWWAHRLMLVLAKGEPPTPKHEAGHDCCNGHLGCVNPRHLSWKTRSENQKERTDPRVNCPGPKPAVTQAQIATMRRLRERGVTIMEIARHVGVSFGCVHYWLGDREKRGHHLETHREFTDAEDKYLRRRVRSRADCETVARHLRRSSGSVRARAYRIGVIVPKARRSKSFANR